MMLQQMGADNMFEGAFVEVSCNYNGMGVLDSGTFGYFALSFGQILCN